MPDSIKYGICPDCGEYVELRSHSCTNILCEVLSEVIKELENEQKAES